MTLVQVNYTPHTKRYLTQNDNTDDQHFANS